jgi:hypothetical protein
LIMKPWKTRAGRWQIRLSERSHTKSFYTYRLVAMAFLGPPPFESAEVAHKDDDKDNNALANLKWCSHQENCQDRRSNGKAALGLQNGAHTHPHRRPRGERVGNSKLTSATVREIRSASLSHRALARKYGVSKTTVGHIKRGNTWALVL